MGLREIAEADLATIMEDRQGGFGWNISLVDPSGVVYLDFVGFSADISQVFDPETGTMVTGRSASVALRLSTLYLAGITQLPQGIANSSQKPWVVSFLDINGLPGIFKVVESRPDRALGLLVLILETYKP